MSISFLIGEREREIERKREREHPTQRGGNKLEKDYFGSYPTKVMIEKLDAYLESILVR